MQPFYFLSSRSMTSATIRSDHRAKTTTARSSVNNGGRIQFQNSSHMRRQNAPLFPLPTSDFRLSTFDFRLPTSDFRFPTSDFQLPTSNFLLPTSHLPLSTSDLTPLSGSISARSATRVLMLKVKAQYKERLYRSSHKRGQLKLLL